jgi:hypothetical protein
MIHLHQITPVVNYWITSTGDRISVRNLTTSHIENIARWRLRGAEYRGQHRSAMLEAVRQEAIRRGMQWD